MVPQATVPPLSEQRRDGTEPIAIVGIGCRFPGAHGPQAYWRLLCEGTDPIREIPPDRWDVDALYDPDPAAPGKMITRWGGFLEGVDRFDAGFFGLSPREANHVDPQQRLVLEMAWEALEDAGIPPTALAGTPTGVFLATLATDYATDLFTAYGDRVEAYSGTGTTTSLISSRIAYFLDLRGPNLTVDTACSGSLTALYLACESLRQGDCSLALAGGVNLILRPDAYLFFSKAGALAPDGRCKPFDARANGIVRSDGVGVLVLQPLSRALADGSDIYALLLGGALNQDGRSAGVMSPNGEAQEELLRRAYARCGVAPADVQYIEAHGTGTVVGDPIEASALGAVLQRDRPAGRVCALGSAKSNIGHSEAAAGVAGVIKVALALLHRKIPATLHFQTPNPMIHFEALGLRVQRELGPWPSPDRTLIAGVSGFGIGGANAHLVLQEPPRPPEPQADTGLELARGTHVLALSARSAEALAAQAESFEELLERSDAPPLHQVCFTAALHRSHLEHRLGVAAASTAEASAKLAAFLAGESASGTTAARVPIGSPPKLALFFSGQGSHWCRMGHRLLGAEPVFAEVIHRCDETLRELAGWSLLEELAAPEERCRLSETSVAQPSIFAVQVALAGLWRSWGVVPDAVVGQSLGEVAAAHVAGALDLDDALRVVFHRSRLMQRVAGLGGTAVVGLAEEQTNLVLTGFDGALSIAGTSSPTSTVVSGDRQALDRLLAALEARGVFARGLQGIDVAFHSPQMEPLAQELAAALSGLTPRATAVRLVSTVTGAEIRGEELDAGYWARNLRQPFRFSQAVEHLLAGELGAFLEVGPHAVLGGAVRQILRHLDREALVLASMLRGEEEASVLGGALAALYAHGYPVDWRGLYPRPLPQVKLPSYPWQRQRFWLDRLREGEREGHAGAVVPRGGTHPLLGFHLAAASPAGHHLWEQELGAHSLHWLDEHRIHGAAVFPATAHLEMARRAAEELLGPGGFDIEDVAFAAPLVLAEDGRASCLQLILQPDETGGARFRLFSRAGGDGAGSVDVPWTLHSSGQIRRTPVEAPPAPALDLDEARRRCAEVVSPQEHYRAMGLRGFEYGSTFRGVVGLQRREGEALARLQLPSGSDSTTSPYWIHPALLDAALQTAAQASVRPQRPDLEPAPTLLPVGLGRLRVWQRPEPGGLWCHAALGPDADHPEAQRADIVLGDDSGRLVAEIQGLRLQRLTTDRSPKSLLYRPCWEPSPRPPAAAGEPGFWILLADSQGIAEDLEQLLEARGDWCLEVRPAAEFSVAERRVGLDPHQPGDFKRLVEHARAGSSQRCKGIVSLWSLDAPPSEALSAVGLEESLATGTAPIFWLVQALAEADWRRTIDSVAQGIWQDLPRLWIVTRGAQPVEAGERVAVAQAPAWGLGRVMLREHPELFAGLVDLDPQAPPPLAAAQLCDELACPAADAGVAFRNGERYAPRLEVAGPVGRARPLRPDASYLVTGGLGGLGLLVARWLAENGARRLVLAGRSPLPPRQLWGDLEAGSAEGERTAAIRELEALGVSVHPVAVDIADEAQLTAFLDRHRREGWPPIRGVVHAAGVLSDRLLARMTPEALAAAWRPKILGTWLLHELFEDEPLDFFVLFSSVASVLGTFGQGNYAAGNAFLDAVAQDRRAAGLPALSVNWGPWAQVGMAARTDPASMQAQVGIQSISPDEGLDCLDRALRGDQAQLLAARVDWDLWAHSPPGGVAGNLAARLVERAEGPEGPGSGGQVPRGTFAEEILALAEPEQRRARVLERLLEVCAAVARLEPAQLDPRLPLPALGFDSILTAEVRGQVRKHFGVEIPLARMLLGANIAQVAELVLAALAAAEGGVASGAPATEPLSALATATPVA